MERIRIYAPDGEVGPAAVQRAASPELLRGLRLAVLDNGKPNADVLLGQLAQRLAERTGARYAGLRRKPGGAALPAEAELLAELAREADVVLTGSAD
jgi:hypothetical protein